MDLRPGERGGEHPRKFYERLAEGLSAYVATKAKYDTPDSKGESRRARNIRFDFAELNPPDEPPEDGEHILEWFWDLSSGRPDSWSGCAPIDPVYLAGWASSTGEILTRDEVALIRRMDAAYRAALAEEREAQRKREEGGNG